MSGVVSTARDPFLTSSEASGTLQENWENQPVSVLVVTGGSRGIGAAICRNAASKGWACCVNYAKDERGALSVLSDITSMGGKAIAVRADVADPAQVESMFIEVDQKLGPVAGLVNNAGVMGSPGRVEDLDADLTRRLFEVNAFAPFLCSKEALKRMSRRCGGKGGGIVNISSAAAKHGGAGSYVDYAASKGALDTFTVGLAREQAAEGVRVNCIRPGAILTEISKAWLEDHPGWLESVISRTPLGRPGEEVDIANATLWLLSEEAKYVTGAILDVSGGWVSP
jgi:NAD(P)-dependent dehydrogenase (short-subunit alcohol dehydrogenase family)